MDKVGEMRRHERPAVYSVTIVRLRGIVTVDVRCACAVPHHLTWPQYRTLQDGYLWVLSITQYRTLQDGY